jgi:general secretion pathway protein D
MKSKSQLEASGIRMRKLFSSGIVIYMVVWVMCVPIAGAAAANGKKHFKEGIHYAQARRWDKAAERLALAVAEEPSNIEYQLHLQSALVNAAIMYVDLGDRLAAGKDYNAAYRAYQQAYAFDAANVNTLVKMRHMLEAQGTTSPLPSAEIPAQRFDTPATTVPTSSGGEPAPDTAQTQKPLASFRRDKRTDVIFQNANLLGAIVQIAQSMHLNVAFEQQAELTIKSRPLNVELRDVTVPEALEIILQTNNLMYSQVGRRTIVITMDSPQNRMRLEQMAMRKFFIKNADINDLKSTIAGTIGTKQILASKQLNVLVVRDSKANLDLIGSMIDSLDKSKAEVLIDISLYEVSQNDLLQLGNQFLATGTATSGPSLSSDGGVGQQRGLVGTAVRTLKGPLSFGLGLPTSTLSFFQDRGKAKLLAFTQVHVLDNEQHQVRIGQRVPVKTGSSAVLSLGSTSTATTNPATGTPTTPTSSGLGTVDNIQYENVGLNIDMQPQVFDDEVQVKMKIESSSVDRSTGDLTPSFNQRTMSSVARIRDGQTTMIAAISRTEDSRQVKGLPFFGSIPILGRLFSTPATSNQQNHVVITVTPHILRRADIREEDRLTKDAGRGADSSQQLTLQEIINRADEDDERQNRAVALEAGHEKDAMPRLSESKPAEKEPSTRGATGIDPGGIVKNSPAPAIPGPTVRPAKSIP